MDEQQKEEDNQQYVVRYRGRKIETIKDIEKFTKVKMSKKVGFVILLVTLTLIISIFFDIRIDLKLKLYDWLKGILEKYNDVLYQYILEVKTGIVEHRESYCNLVVTLNTILASAVVFFYSVQDNKKGGIPHRTIISYSIGSLSIPILYIITMILVPLSYFSYALKLRWTIYICLIWTYIIQMIIVYLILLSTSAQYSIHAISNLEIRQFRILTKLEKAGWEIIGQRDSSYAWTYLLHHLIEVMKSDELSSDKLTLLRKYVWVPYCGRELHIRNYIIGKRNNIEAEKFLFENSLGQTYEFYRSNLLSIFNYLEQEYEEENKEKVFLILYEFIQQLTSKLPTYNEQEYLSSKKVYLMTIISIIIALLESDLKEAEMVCLRILNDVLRDERKTEERSVTEIHSELVALYVMAQEYIYYVDKRKVRLNSIDKVRGVENWGETFEKSCELFQEIWETWMSRTSIEVVCYNNYFYKILQAIYVNGENTIITAYINFRKGKKQ